MKKQQASFNCDHEDLSFYYNVDNYKFLDVADDYKNDVCYKEGVH